MTKGKHEVKWDGLTTLNCRTPGEPVPPGDYTWRAIWHKGIGLRLRGWACNGGNAPWDSGPTANWGGDHGVPCACAADGEKVFLGWSGAEAGKALLACDLQGNVQWKNSRQGMAGAEFVAVDGDMVYAVNWGGELQLRLSPPRRLTARTARYRDNSPDLMLAQVFGRRRRAAQSRSTAWPPRDGKLYLSVNDANETKRRCVGRRQDPQAAATLDVAAPRQL